MRIREPDNVHRIQTHYDTIVRYIVAVVSLSPPGSGSASVHADPDPGGLQLCGSMLIRIRNIENNRLIISNLKVN